METTALSWNEIKDRALCFSKEWTDTSNEEADAKPFLEAFFNVFRIGRKRVSLFEQRVKKFDCGNRNESLENRCKFAVWK